MQSSKQSFIFGLSNFLFLVLIVLWGLNYYTQGVGTYSPVFELAYPIFILVLGVLTFIGSRNRALAGKNSGAIYMSLGFLAWGIGESLWYYYTKYTQTEIPYPSLADAAYLTFYPLAIFSALQHIRDISGKELWNLKLIRVFWKILLVIVCVSYVLITLFATNQASTEVTKAFFDVSYLTWDALLLVFLIAMLGQILYVANIHKFFYYGTIKFVLGMLVLFVADITFSYMTEFDLYTNGGVPDLLFIISVFLLAHGTLKLSQGYDASSTS